MILAIICILFVVVFFRLNYLLNYWKSRNVPFVSTSVFSSTLSLVHFPTPFFNYYAEIYAALKGCKFGGCFWLFKPQFVVRDPELIKHILTKDFQHFRDRGFVFFEETDSLSKHLFSAPGDFWRALRVRLSPTFTSGKMKFMYERVKECAEEYQQILEKPAAQGISLNFKDVSVGYTVQVISSTAFGWESNSIQDSNSELKRVGQQVFRPGLRVKYKRILEASFPSLKPYINVPLLPSWIRNFFLNSVRETMEYRKKTECKRDDFFQLLMALNEETSEKQEQPKTTFSSQAHNELNLTNELLTAQCLFFFAAGFEPSSFVLSMTLLELAVNTDIQKTLQQEIDDFTNEDDAQISYEMVKSMPYLHKVVQETVRKYPVLPFLSRVCTKTYNVPDTDIILEKGTEVIIPVSGMHRDAEFYPNPDVYDPERFSAEEIQKRHHYAFLSFGEGPRKCIGYRFAQMTVKLAIIHILKKFNLSKTTKTVYPVQFLPNKIISEYKYPLLLQCSLRQ